MSFSTSPTGSNGSSPVWPTVVPYTVPPAALTGIVPALRDCVARNGWQNRQAAFPMTVFERWKTGAQAAQTASSCILRRKVFRSVVERVLVKGPRQTSFSFLLACPALTAVVAASAENTQGTGSQEGSHPVSRKPSPVSSSRSGQNGGSTPPGSGGPSRVWTTIAPYVVPPAAASVAIVPVFRDMVAKSAQQRGQPVSRMTIVEGLKGGAKAAPTVGVIVGGQMVLQRGIEGVLVGDSSQATFFTMLASSALVGTASAPVLAVFNGQTMGWGVRESLSRFTWKQAMAIAAQETGCVGGLSAADRLAIAMRKRFGNNKAVDYSAAFIAGAAGALAGHPGNTALTRWQSGMTVDSFSQSMWGSLRRARALGGFSVVYKFVKEAMNSTTQSSDRR